LKRHIFAWKVRLRQDFATLAKHSSYHSTDCTRTIAFLAAPWMRVNALGLFRPLEAFSLVPGARQNSFQAVHTSTRLSNTFSTQISRFKMNSNCNAVVTGKRRQALELAKEEGVTQKQFAKGIRCVKLHKLIYIFTLFSVSETWLDKKSTWKCTAAWNQYENTQRHWKMSIPKVFNCLLEWTGHLHGLVTI